MMLKAKKFTRWLFRKRDEDSYIGDLARDAYTYDKWPVDGDCFSIFYERLVMAHACSGAIDALVDAYSQYSGIDYRVVFDNCNNSDDDDFDALHIASAYPKAEENETYIYFLLDEWYPFYVGQTVKPALRLRQHIFNPGAAIRERIENMLEVGKAPLMKIIDCVPANKGTAYERAYIDMLSSDYSLLNIRLVTK